MNQRIPMENLENQQGSNSAETEAFNFYEKREQIYTRRVKGAFQRLRLWTAWPLMLLYFILPWVNIRDRQSVLFDAPNDQFHIFWLTLWPEDFVLLALVLIIAAFALLALTIWLGRVWCGYSCPQTVWTSWFIWTEELTEGGRNARIKLNQAPWSLNKLFRKSAKHSLWLLISLLTAVTFVGYFTPIRELMPDLLSFGLSGWETFWIGFFVLGTYGNAGWMREQVCKYMCPYARFQAVMFDSDTLVVSYDAARGESRGGRKKRDDYQAKGMGDCIDCYRCVQVCPVGIDIRDGLQYECINCGLCVDACDEVMEKMEYQKRLVSYTTENKLAHKQQHRVMRPKLLGYGLALLVMVGLFSFMLTNRDLIEVDVTRDRGQLYQVTQSGMVENVYRMSVLNMDAQPRQYRVIIEGLKGAVLTGDVEFDIDVGKQRELLLIVRVPPANLVMSNVPFSFVVTTLDGALSVEEETRFIGGIK